MAYTQIYYHLIFRTKFSKPSINLEQSDKLYKYIWGIIENKKCTLYQINGMEDHLHILTSLHPTLSLSDFVKDIKVASSKWAKESGLFPGFNGWGKKYAALTCSYINRETIVNYIKNQREHHKVESFKSEIHKIWIDYNLKEDEKWFWEEN